MGLGFAYVGSLTMMLLVTCALVFGQPTGTVSQTVNVQTANYATGQPMPAQSTVTFTCMNPDGSWYPYAVVGPVGPQGATFTISCRSPSTFNPWIHVYGQSGYWFGISDYNGIPIQGGTTVNVLVILTFTGSQGRDSGYETTLPTITFFV